MQYEEIFSVVKIEKFSRKKKNLIILIIFAQNNHRTHLNCLAEAVLMSTHNLCFRAKIRKIGIPLYTPVLQNKCRV